MATLEIKIIETELGFLLQIVRQDYRGVGFNDGDNTFIAKNDGFELLSDVCPAIDDESGILFLRGRDKDKDHKILITQNYEYIGRLKQAVREYNDAMEGNIDGVCKVEIIK